MGEIGKYIYGVINSNAERQFVPCGTTDSEEVYSIPYRDISAVVSDSEIVDYTHIFKDALARLLLRHQEVIESVMNSGFAVIPVKLGTFTVAETEIMDILNKGYSLIKNIIQETSDKTEIDVCATWSDLNSVLKEIGEEKEVKEFKEKLLSNSKGITVDDQMKTGLLVKKILERKRQKYAKKIQNSLDFMSQGVKQHELMDDTMVINTAFLLDKRWREDFYKKLERLNAEFSEKVNFRCVGPLPPYSFYTLEIKRMRFEEIEWARKKLELFDDFADGHEIKMSYKRLASFYHPDKNPQKQGIEKQFDDVIKAYKILGEYCLVGEQSGQGDRCFFNEEEFQKNAILVRVRG